MQRSIKEQLHILRAAASGFSTIEESFADEAQGDADRTSEQEENYFRAQLKIEGRRSRSDFWSALGLILENFFGNFEIYAGRRYSRWLLAATCNLRTCRRPCT
jgi:hypothetical protein